MQPCAFQGDAILILFPRKANLGIPAIIGHRFVEPIGEPSGNGFVVHPFASRFSISASIQPAAQSWTAVSSVKVNCSRFLFVRKFALPSSVKRLPSAQANVVTLQCDRLPPPTPPPPPARACA